MAAVFFSSYGCWVRSTVHRTTSVNYNRGMKYYEIRVTAHIFQGNLWFVQDSVIIFTKNREGGIFSI